MADKCTKKSDEQPECCLAYETSCLFGDLAVIAIAIAIAKSPWSTCKGTASYQELWLHSILF